MRLTCASVSGPWPSGTIDIVPSFAIDTLVFGGTRDRAVVAEHELAAIGLQQPERVHVQARAARVRLRAVLRLHRDPARAFDRDVERRARLDQRSLRVVETDAGSRRC